MINTSERVRWRPELGSRRVLAPYVVSALVVMAAGCAPSIHSARFGIAAPDNDPVRIEAALARIAAAPEPHDHALAYGVGGDPSEIFVVDLGTGEELWRRPATLTSWPHAAGDVLVSHEGSRIVARDIRTGVERFSFADAGLWLVGAAGEGHLGAFTLSNGTSAESRSELIIVRGTEIAHRLPAQHPMGSPEVSGGLVLVPWGSQYLSFLDPTTTEEVARVRVRGTVLGHAFAHEGHVYVGQRELFRLTPSLASGEPRASARFTPPAVDLPGRPAFMVDPYQAPPTIASAVHRVRLAYRATGTGEDVRLTDGTYYALFHRVVFALDAESGEVRWTYESDRDLSGAEALAGLLVLGDTHGAVTVLDARDGSVRLQHAGTHRASVMRFHVHTLDVPAATAARGVTLSAQLASVANHGDTRMAPASAFALRALESLPGEGPTEGLLTACQSRSASPFIRDEACHALSQRREGHGVVLAALAQRSDFLSGAAVPELEPLAQAAARMRAHDAIPLLAGHLADPATPDDALPVIVRSLAALGTDAAVAPLLRFLRVYHADASGRGMSVALEAALVGAWELNAALAHDTVAAVAHDPLTPAPLRQRASGLQETYASVEVAAQAERDQADVGTDASRVSSHPGSAVAQVAPAPTTPVPHLTSAIVQQALAPGLAGIRACMAEAAPSVESLRLVMAINPTGEWASVSTSPPTLADCVEPIVRAQSVPAVTSTLRQRVTFVITPSGFAP